MYKIQCVQKWVCSNTYHFILVVFPLIFIARKVSFSLGLMHSLFIFFDFIRRDSPLKRFISILIMCQKSVQFSMLILIYLIRIFFACEAYVLCKNGRACLSGYKCSLDGVECCRHLSSCSRKFRSSWSLLNSTCLPNKNLKACPDNELCTGDPIKCIPEVFSYECKLIT